MVSVIISSHREVAGLASSVAVMVVGGVGSGAVGCRAPISKSGDDRAGPVRGPMIPLAVGASQNGVRSSREKWGMGARVLSSLVIVAAQVASWAGVASFPMVSEALAGSAQV